MNDHNNSKKLKLKRDTLRKLDTENLAGVAGGLPETLTSLVSAWYKCPGSTGISWTPAECCKK